MEALTIRIVKINNRPALIYQDFIFDIKNQEKVKRVLDIANIEVDLVKSNYGAPRSKRWDVIEAVRQIQKIRSLKSIIPLCQ